MPAWRGARLLQHAKAGAMMLNAKLLATPARRLQATHPPSNPACGLNQPEQVGFSLVSSWFHVVDLCLSEELARHPPAVQSDALAPHSGQYACRWGFTHVQLHLWPRKDWLVVPGSAHLGRMCPLGTAVCRNFVSAEIRKFAKLKKRRSIACAACSATPASSARVQRHVKRRNCPPRQATTAHQATQLPLPLHSSLSICTPPSLAGSLSLLLRRTTTTTTTTSTTTSLLARCVWLSRGPRAHLAAAAHEGKLQWPTRGARLKTCACRPPPMHVHKHAHTEVCAREHNVSSERPCLNNVIIIQALRRLLPPLLFAPL